VVSRLANGKPLYTLRGHTGEVNDVAISPDGNLLVSVSSGDRTIRVWDLLQSGELLKTIPDPKGPTSQV
jgi:WD40 repeat protein